MEEAFLEHIREQPDDEAARLAYADWLMEQGDPARAARGEFIHVQCQLARWDEESTRWGEWAEAAGRLKSLRRREQGCFTVYRTAWSAPVLSLVQSCEFRRGFVEKVGVDASAFLKHGEELFRRAPVQHVRFQYLYPSVEALAKSPLLDRLRGLELQNAAYPADDQLRRLLDSPHLTRLKTLTLEHVYPNGRQIDVLAAAPLLGRLHTLDLRGNLIDTYSLLKLARSPHLPGLRVARLMAYEVHVDWRSPRSPGTLATLSETLSERREPGVFRVLLWVLAGRANTFCNPDARGLARRAGAGVPAAVLAEGLGDSRPRVRAAAAHLLAREGPEAAGSLPGVVRRLYEPNPAGRREASAALARLLPALPGGLQTWLCILAHPLRSPADNLRAAFAAYPPLTPAVRQAFGELLTRRAAWWGRLGRPVPVPQESPHDGSSSMRLAQELAAQCGEAAFRHARNPQGRDTAREDGRQKEFAWLVARLCELLQDMP